MKYSSSARTAGLSAAGLGAVQAQGGNWWRSAYSYEVELLFTAAAVPIGRGGRPTHATSYRSLQFKWPGAGERARSIRFKVQSAVVALNETSKSLAVP